MIIEGHDLLEKYRRLRILYNRISLFGEHTFYSDWFHYMFNTNLGPRNFVCSHFELNGKDLLEFYYEKDGETLFSIQVNKKEYHFQNRGMNEEQAWLAIHELEELSYKELKSYETI